MSTLILEQRWWHHFTQSLDNPNVEELTCDFVCGSVRIILSSLTKIFVYTASSVVGSSGSCGIGHLRILKMGNEFIFIWPHRVEFLFTAYVIPRFCLLYKILIGFCLSIASITVDRRFSWLNLKWSRITRGKTYTKSVTSSRLKISLESYGVLFIRRSSLLELVSSTLRLM